LENKIVSTRSSIWCGEDHGKHVHIYWELAEREVENGRMTAAPIYMAVDHGDSDAEIKVRLPTGIAKALLTVLKPDDDLAIL
jgi:hypothetical protein